MGSFSRGLYLGVSVVESHGTSFLRVKGMDFRVRAMRFMRAKGEGVADIRVRGCMSVDILIMEEECQFNFLTRLEEKNVLA
jgi:hypothetical protein